MEEKKIYDDGIKLVYPNPTTDWVNIHLAVSRSGNCTLRIIDNTGKTIDTLLDQWIESGAYNFEYNTRDLPAGNYFLFLKSPSGESIKGIVVRL
ncbi:MAG: T9SS type A sorting domain-containing protein [Bacteroidota bacterium]